LHASAYESARCQGFEGAHQRLTEEFVAGKYVALLLKPVGVVARRSSDILAIEDDDVASAVRFIRDHGHTPLHVRDILAHAPVSRRSLERRFRGALRRSMLDEIRRVHFDLASRLLTETEFPVPTVAESSGFTEAKQLWLVFRLVLRQTPTEYRRATRHPSGLMYLSNK
jgi:LacI family transcriptional regulator